jgi:hypothetical protein
METDDARVETNDISRERALAMQNDMFSASKGKTISQTNHAFENPFQFFGSVEEATKQTMNLQKVIVPKSKYNPTQIIKQPKRYRHVRMITDLAKNDCPIVQAGEEKTQRTYVEIEVSSCILMYIEKGTTFF